MKFYQTSDLHNDLNYVQSPEGYFLGGVQTNQYHKLVVNDWSKCDPEIPLFIVGDTANLAEYVMLVVSEAAKYFRKVVFISGNHEFYSPMRRTVPQVEAMLREFASQHPNVHFLEPNAPIRFGKTLVVGGTGWYNFDFFSGSREQEYKSWRKGSNDAKCIRFEKMPDRMAYDHMTEIAAQVRLAQDDPAVEEICVFTHTVPHRRFVPLETHPYAAMNGSYLNTYSRFVLEADVRKKIVSWGFGHTHYPFDYDIDHIRYVCVPKGYYDQQKDRYWDVPYLVDTEVKSAFA